MNDIMLDKVKKSKDTMLERTYVEFNGVEFKVVPVFLGEERDFFADFKFNILPIGEDEKLNYSPTDEEKITHLMALFRPNEAELDDMGLSSILKSAKKQNLFSLIFKNNKKKKYDSKAIYGSCLGYGLIKWLEKKIYVDNKLINFAELERTYGLTKLEIYELILVFMQLSNFPMHLPKK